VPVQNYGVVIGQFDHLDRDDANHYGNYYHGHIFVRLGNGTGFIVKFLTQTLNTNDQGLPA
jgi:hypothetical protein